MPSPSVTSPQVAVNDIGSAEDFLPAIDKTIKYFNDGDIVDGIIVKVIDIALRRLIPQMPQESLERFTKHYQALIFND